MKIVAALLVIVSSCLAFGDPSAHIHQKERKAAVALYMPDAGGKGDLGSDIACAAVGAGAVGGLWYGEDHFGHEEHKRPTPVAEPTGFAVLAVSAVAMWRRRKKMAG